MTAHDLIAILETFAPNAPVKTWDVDHTVFEDVTGINLSDTDDPLCNLRRGDLIIVIRDGK